MTVRQWMGVCFLGVISLAAHADSQRFSVKGNEVYDAKTNLTWARCNLGQSWDDSRGWCSGVARKLNMEDAKQAVKQEHGGWRLPTLDEVRSVSDTACIPQAIQQSTGQVLFGDMAAGPSDWYLTASMNDDSHVMAFTCLGRQFGGLGRKFLGSVRLVRSGQ